MLMCFSIILQYFLKIRISPSIVKLVSAFNATYLACFFFSFQKSKTDEGAICIKEKHNKENV